MRIVFDPRKRERTLSARALDFAHRFQVFADRHVTQEDVRVEYGERRWITVGFPEGRMVVVVWTERGDARRVISLRKANEREQARYAQVV